MKQLYIEMCNTKECEQKAKKELANLLDLQTEQLKKTQVELETERKKVFVLMEMLNILDLYLTPWYRICLEMLILG